MKRQYLHLLGIKGGAAMLLFASQVLPAWCLTIDQFGVWSYLNSLLVILSVLAVWGTDRYCLKNVAIWRSGKRETRDPGAITDPGELVNQTSGAPKVKRMVSSAYAVVLINVIILSVGLLIWLPQKLPNEFSFSLWFFLAFLLLSRSLAILSNGITKGISLVVLSELLFSLLRPLVFAVLVLIGYLAFGSFSLNWLLSFLAFSFLFSAIACHWVNSRNSIIPSIVSVTATKTIYRSAFFFLVISVGLPIMTNINTIQLGHMSSKEEVALYSTAAKLVSLVLLGLVSANLLIAPKLGPLFHQRQIAGMKRLIRHNNLVVSLITVVPVLLLVFCSEFVLMVFGPEYRPAAPLLRTLMIGQAISVICGPVVLTSTMVGLQRHAATIVLSACAINWLACLILIPPMGAMGAVIASIIGSVIMNVCLAVLIYRSIGLDVTMLNLIR